MPLLDRLRGDVHQLVAASRQLPPRAVGGHNVLQVLDVLQQYFDSSPDNRFPNPTVPFTLLDLGANKGHVSATLTGPYLELVTALSPLGKTARQNLIQFAGSAAGRLSLFVQGTLRAGDVALVDVITLCNYLQNQTTVGTPAERQAIGLAAGKVAAALTGSASSLPLVRSVFESADSGQQLGFTGVSVLYKPNQFPSGDPTLLWLVHYDYYASLPFAQETKQSGSCWPVYAFEQLGFNPTC